MPPLPDDYEEREEQELVEIMRELTPDRREELVRYAKYLHSQAAEQVSEEDD